MIPLSLFGSGAPASARRGGRIVGRDTAGSLLRVLLLTGATGTVGRALLRRLTDGGTPVRCLVRDPRRLGDERVRVQIALGDLGDHLSFRHALRGVDTVVHMASVIRDQPNGSIEELAGVATWRLVRAAEREGVRRFVFFSLLGASTHGRTRLMRAKAIAERAVIESSLDHTVFAPSIVYAPGDPYLTLLGRMSWLPVMPIPGDGLARFEPIWAGDVADCVLAVLPGGRAESEAIGARYELAGPETLTQREITEIALRSFGRRRPIVGIPTPDSATRAEARRAARGPDGVRDLGRGRTAPGSAGRGGWHGRRGAAGGHAAADRRGARPRTVEPASRAQACARTTGALARAGSRATAGPPREPAGRSAERRSAGRRRRGTAAARSRADR